MFQINNILLNNATEKDKQIITNSTIKKIDKEILPKVASPSSNVENIDNFENRINKQLLLSKIKFQKENNNINLLPIKNKRELLKFQKILNSNCNNNNSGGGNSNNNETIQSFINDRLKVDKNSNLYGVGRNVKDVYCIFGKYQLKKSIIKVTKPDPSIPISSLELLAVYTKAYQYMYKEQEKWFDHHSKKRIINAGIQKSPYGIYKYGINDIHYNGLSTIIEFDSFIVISFDVDPK